MTPAEMRAALLAETTERLSNIFARHERAYVAFSGGKDSVVLADLCIPWRSQVTLLWVNTGIMWPHMVEFVRGYSGRFNLVELSSDALADWRKHGTPVDILPVRNLTSRDAAHIQPWVSCCSRNRSLPIDDYLLSRLPGAYLHGQRYEDNGNVSDEQRQAQYPGGEVWAPLTRWTAEDVFAYIQSRNLQLPKQYPEVPSSLECAICPANQPAHVLRYLQREAPSLAHTVKAVMRDNLRIARTAVERLEAIINEGEVMVGSP